MPGLDLHVECLAAVEIYADCRKFHKILLPEDNDILVRDCNDAHGHDLACICPFLPGGPKCFDVLKTQLSVCQGQCKFSFSLRLKSALIATRVHDLISEKHVHMPRARMGYQGLECGSGSRLNCHRGTPSICSHWTGRKSKLFCLGFCFILLPIESSRRFQHSPCCSEFRTSLWRKDFPNKAKLSQQH